MSSAGFNNLYSRIWISYTHGYFSNSLPNSLYTLRPVLNLKLDTQISDGDGTKENPFVIQ